MKKIAAALALAGLCVAANAAIVQWTVTGTVSDNNTFQPTPFLASISVDTKLFQLSAMGNYQAFGGAQLSWSVPGSGGGSCGGGGTSSLATMSAYTSSFSIDVVDMRNDCALAIRGFGSNIGDGFVESLDESLSRSYNMSLPGATLSVTMGGLSSFQSIEVTSFKQSIPEPGTLALAGLAGLGALASRRRRITA